MQVFGELGPSGDLLSRRTPFVDVFDRQACFDNGVHISGNGSVLLHDAICQPAGRARTLDQVVLERPNAPAIGQLFEGLLRWRTEDRVFDREHESPAVDQGVSDLAEEASQVADIVKCQRAEHEVGAAGSERELVEVGSLILNGVRFRVGSSSVEHLFGKVNPLHRRGAVFHSPSTEPSEATTQVENSCAGKVGQHCSQRQPLSRTIEASHLTVELRISPEELGIVVDVLRHRRTIKAPR